MTQIEDRLAEARLRRTLPAPAMRVYLRRAAGLHQRHVAEECGVDRATVARWESAARNPSGEHLRRYAALLSRLAAELAQ